jgi:hypothetical protein
MLHQRLAHTLRNAAVNLAFAKQWVDDTTGIVDHREPGKRGGTCVGVNLDLADMTPVRFV